MQKKNERITKSPFCNPNGRAGFGKRKAVDETTKAQADGEDCPAGTPLSPQNHRSILLSLEG